MDVCIFTPLTLGSQVWGDEIHVPTAGPLSISHSFPPDDSLEERIHGNGQKHMQRGLEQTRIGLARESNPGRAAGEGSQS